jgi:hypothetical protein
MVAVKGTQGRAGYASPRVSSINVFCGKFLPVHLDGLNTAAFQTAAIQGLREEWLSPEYVTKIQRDPLTKLNKAVLERVLYIAKAHATSGRDAMAACF